MNSAAKGIKEFANENEALTSPLIKTSAEMGILLGTVGGLAIVIPKVAGALGLATVALLGLSAGVGAVILGINLLIENQKMEQQVTEQGMNQLVKQGQLRMLVAKLYASEGQEIIKALQELVAFTEGMGDLDVATKQWVVSAKAFIETQKDLTLATKEGTDAYSDQALAIRRQAQAIAEVQRQRLAEFQARNIGGGTGGQFGDLISAEQHPLLKALFSLAREAGLNISGFASQRIQRQESEAAGQIKIALQGLLLEAGLLGRSSQTTNLVVDGEVLASVVSPHLGASTMKRGRLGG